ncbi:carbohydrate-binding module family 1 protein [Macrolepiota fuliginosa MF-IS2]|uniref:Carbohydrate-binding module family 1 protein n=1 Tax=Macrolepiota fuliginosa MF-IS2 TaxID=1400762 RepID=A0A9P5XL29_9AGAR|nr:carbohydrate-binding module family 1 protein [Macrolepiota fuliginosa MF-IS2]
MHFVTFATAAILSFALGGVNAQSPAWGQCGGQGWSGPTTCVSGYTCTYNNTYHSQCLPETTSTITTSTPISTVAPTSTSPSSATTTSSGATPTGSQIRAVQDPVFHFYLQNNGGKPQLGPEASSGYFTVSGTISLNQSSGSKLYLNVNTSASTSYKPLTLDATATTTDWGLEGDTIITTAPRQLNFIACATSNPSFYDLYLQTGNDTPSGASCTLQTIHLPCLC